VDLAEGLYEAEEESMQRKDIVREAMLALAYRMPLIPLSVVEINLRLPSMLHGKKGFERIVWAFKNALTTSVTWLFYDLSAEANYSDQGKNIPSGSCILEMSLSTDVSRKFAEETPPYYH
jgi:hypothetical protein